MQYDLVKFIHYTNFIEVEERLTNASYQQIVIFFPDFALFFIDVVTPLAQFNSLLFVAQWWIRITYNLKKSQIQMVAK